MNPRTSGSIYVFKAGINVSGIFVLSVWSVLDFLLVLFYFIFPLKQELG